MSALPEEFLIVCTGRRGHGDAHPDQVLHRRRFDPQAEILQSVRKRTEAADPGELVRLIDRAESVRERCEVCGRDWRVSSARLDQALVALIRAGVSHIDVNELGVV